MLNPEVRKLFAKYRETGWVLEPDAKRILSLCGMHVPKFGFADTSKAAARLAENIGYPLVAKIVSPEVMHKSDTGGVVLGVKNEAHLLEIYARYAKVDGFRGLLVEEMVAGVELILGAKIDHQFGPVVLLGIGGTGVEIYNDVAIRMAPLKESDVVSMLNCLKAGVLLQGYRGSNPVGRGPLIAAVLHFSNLLMEIHGLIESIDLNPVFCSEDNCIVGDARMILRKSSIRAT